MLDKRELFTKIQNLSISESEINRFPPEIDELALILSRELYKELSERFQSITLTLNDWTRFQAILQTKLAYTIRRTKFTPPEFPNQKVTNNFPISYDLGKGRVTIGTKVICSRYQQGDILGTVTDLTLYGDITVKSDFYPYDIYTTKWQYVEPS